MRTTVDFGIDLGTTNSEVAFMDGNNIVVIKNIFGSECTPSAVYIDKSGRTYVGQQAKERYFYDENEARIEFKREMGTGNSHTFPSTGKVMTPVELSAEVLKSLKSDVERRLNGEKIHSAVITVPADFNQPQNDATQKAALLAGLEDCVLLQEPIAAATAYGFRSLKDKVFWMVYDFGGGTFDVAIIQLSNGHFGVLDHKGDNFLGGADLDWAIVEKLIVPEVIKQHHLDDFTRENKLWKSSYAKMKIAAEAAKIQLSSIESTPVIIDNLVKEQGIDFEMDIKQDDIAKLAAPLIVRSIRLCKELIANCGLRVENIEKMILVGGPTLAPYLRAMLTDPNEGLGIPLEYDVDPLTVVARGAAIFASGELLKNRERPKAGTFDLELSYEPIGNDREPTIGGKISSPGISDYSGFSIQISSLNYSSGRIPLDNKGTFITTVLAEPNSQNNYNIELFNQIGDIQIIRPNTFKYTFGNTPDNPPLPHSIGVALTNNEVAWFLQKGQPLPGKGMKTLRTSIELARGNDGKYLDIPIIEGDDPEADLNQLVGRLKIYDTEIKRDIPIDSEIEITLSSDKSRIITASAYVPLLDLDVPSVKFEPGMRKLDVNELNSDLENQKQRIMGIREKTEEMNLTNINSRLDEIDAENSLESIERNINGGELPNAEKHLLDLKKRLALIEKELTWPMLVKEAEREIELANQVLEEKDDPELKVAVRKKENEIRSAIEGKDSYSLTTKIGQMNQLRISAIADDPAFWVGFFQYLIQDFNGSFTNPAQANEYISMGERAINSADLDQLKFVVQSLLRLVPEERQEEAKSRISDVHK